MKYLVAIVFLLFTIVMIGSIQAQEVVVQNPAPIISAPVAAPLGSGGLISIILLVAFSANTMLTALRTVLLKYDGVAPGSDIPADDKALTLVNKICIVLGSILDFLMSNPQH